MNVKKKTTVELLNESEKASLYSISFEMDGILGNGGVKNTRTYEENPKLYGYVLDLQKFETILNESIAKGYVSIEEKELSGIEDITFEI